MFQSILRTSRKKVVLAVALILSLMISIIPLDIVYAEGPGGGSGDSTFFKINNPDFVDEQNQAFLLGWQYIVTCTTSILSQKAFDENDSERIVSVSSEAIDKSQPQVFEIEMDPSRPFKTLMIGPEAIDYASIPGDKKNSFTDEQGNPREKVTIEYNIPSEANGEIEVSLVSDFAGPGGNDPVVIKIDGETILNENVPEGTDPIADGWAERIHFVNGGEIIEIELNDVDNLLNLGSIEITGNRTVALAIREYDHENDSHPTVMIANKSGYSIKSEGSIEILGDWDCSIVLEGSVKAASFRNRDIQKTTIKGGIELNNNENTISIEGNTDITASYEPAFKSVRNVFVNSGANVNVTVSGAGTKAFEDVNAIEVGTGGIIDVKTSDGAVLNAPASVSSIKINDVGTIAEVNARDREGESIPCSIGDKTTTDRYKYDNDGANLRLESTTKPMHSISFQSTDKFDENGNKRDDFVENGTFEVMASSGMKRIDDNGNVDYLFEEGCAVTFKLLPMSGYQYVPGTFAFEGGNGEGEATADPGVYIYHMGNRPVHVRCQFEKAEDTIVNDSKAIAGVFMNVPEGTIASGTAQFDVKDTTLTDAQMESFVAVAGELQLDQTLDLKFGQKIDKIEAEGSWNVPITDLASPMEVSLKLNSDEIYENYAVIREHNGKVEIMESKYDEETNTITFKTNGYSTYAIAHTLPVAPTPDGDDDDGDDGALTGPVAPATGDMTPFVLYLIVMLGAAITVLTMMFTDEKKRRN